MKKFALACYERWKQLPLWLRIGLSFALLDIIYFAHLSLICADFRGDPVPHLLFTVPAYPYVLLWDESLGYCFRFFFRTYRLKLLLQGIAFYFVLGVVFGGIVTRILRQKES